LGRGLQLGLQLGKDGLFFLLLGEGVVAFPFQALELLLLGAQLKFLPLPLLAQVGEAGFALAHLLPLLGNVLLDVGESGLGLGDLLLKLGLTPFALLQALLVVLDLGLLQVLLAEVLLLLSLQVGQVVLQLRQVALLLLYRLLQLLPVLVDRGSLQLAELAGEIGQALLQGIPAELNLVQPLLDLLAFALPLRQGSLQVLQAGLLVLAVGLVPLQVLLGLQGILAGQEQGLGQLFFPGLAHLQTRGEGGQQRFQIGQAGAQGFPFRVFARRKMDPSSLGAGAASDGSRGFQQLPFQGDHAVLADVGPGQLQALENQGGAEHKAKNISVALFKVHQADGVVDQTV
jgi:hypothetical protein